MFGTVRATLNWVAARTGDFDGNGAPTFSGMTTIPGTVAIWLLDGLQVCRPRSLGAVPNNWLIATSGDYLKA